VSGALAPVLHAGHWGWDALFASPALLLVLALVVQALRRRARGEPHPDGGMPPEEEPAPGADDLAPSRPRDA
jgi:hypothetical protein